jgi:hypothetical protein
MEKTIGDVTFRWRRSFRTSPDGEFSEGSKACKWPLRTEFTNNGKLKLASSNVAVTWRLTARHRNAVGRDGLREYRVGTTNTVLHSERTWYYHPSAPHSPHSPQKKVKMVDHLVGTPVWDGNTEDVPPWYDKPGKLKKLKDADRLHFPPGSRKGDACALINFNDAPGTGPLDASPNMGLLRLRGDPLFLINGFDTFCLWLAVSDPEGTVHVLDSFPWYVRYGLRVDGAQVDRKDAFRTLPTTGTYLLSQGPRFARIARLQGVCSEGAMRQTEDTYTRSEVENILGYVVGV